jgi:hypothetical protein
MLSAPPASGEQAATELHGCDPLDRACVLGSATSCEGWHSMHQVALSPGTPCTRDCYQLKTAGPDAILLLQAAGVEVTSRGMQRALLALHAALAVAPESLAAAMGRTPAPDATPALQVHGTAARRAACQRAHLGTPLHTTCLMQHLIAPHRTALQAATPTTQSPCAFMQVHIASLPRLLRLHFEWFWFMAAGALCGGGRAAVLAGGGVAPRAAAGHVRGGRPAGLLRPAAHHRPGALVLQPDGLGAAAACADVSQSAAHAR